MGREAFHRLIRDYIRFGDLAGALRRGTGMNFADLEERWLVYLKLRVSWIPIITSVTTFWFAAAAHLHLWVRAEETAGEPASERDGGGRGIRRVASKRLIITKNKPESKIGLILLAFIAFISLGLPDGLLGVAWPSIRGSFSRPLDSLGILLFAIMAGYLTSSFFSGHLIARLGVGKLLAASCAATGAGLIGYTLAPTWWMIVAFGAVTGLGAGAIDASLNSYIAWNLGKD